MMTREADYAVRAVLFLASQPAGNAVVSTARLAAAAEIPYRFLRRIVRTLTQAGITVCSRGKSGGVRLARDCDAITLLDVLDAVDHRCTKLNSCQLGYETCDRQGHCAVHDALQDIQDSLEQQLRNVTFAQLRDQSSE